jgi:hypothetical protein
MRKADTESAVAVAADPWGERAALWRAELLKDRLVRSGDLPRLRSAWEEAAETAGRRAGADPIVQRSLAEQWLHVYQRYGRMEDLRRAARLVEAALRSNPADVALNAQAALIAAARGRDRRAVELAERTRRLSTLGGNIVRDLGLIHVPAVEHLGGQAAGPAVMRPVKTQFRQRFGGAG